MVSQPFVGRQGELDALLKAIDRPVGQVLLVAGDPGNGKSALLLELSRRLSESPALRFYLHSQAAQTDTPDQRLLDLMGSMVQIEDLTRRRLIWWAPGDQERWRTFLEAIPTIGKWLAALIRADHRPVRSRFLETLALVAGRLEAAGRLVLIFDPEKVLHRDYAAEWLLIAQGLPDRVTVIFAQRQDDVLITDPDFCLLPSVHRVPARPLGHLGREDSDAFIQKLVRQSPELSDLGRPARAEELRALQARFWERYQGYPLAMRIVADELTLFPADPLATVERLPRKLGELFQYQYGRVRDQTGAEGLRLLKALAVQPSTIRLDVLCTVLSLERNAVEPLIARREIRVVLRMENTPVLSFYHPLFQDFVGSQLSPAERKEWHRRSLAAYLSAHQSSPRENEVLVLAAYHLGRSELLADRPREYSEIAFRLGIAFSELPYVNRAANLGQAIACFEGALRVYTEREFPGDWARTQNSLGVAYANLPTGNRADNLAQAIAHFESALRVYTEDAFPADWATMQNNLGLAYENLPTGNRADNLAQAIGCYQAALQVWTERAYPADWARAQNNLGLAYENLPTGDLAANLTKAIVCYQAALRVYTEDAFPVDWARTQNNLGNAYSELPTGDLAANLTKAIVCYQAALRVYTEDAFPVDWATTQNNLGNAYSKLPTGDRADNLGQAIVCYQAALQVRTERAIPTDWATTQNNLGVAYQNLPTGNRADNFAKAIAYFEAALRVYTEDAFPADWARTQNNLGVAYCELPTGNLADNLAKAIACFEATLRVYTEDAFPADWARTQNNLGGAHLSVTTGDRAANLTKAIAYFEAALRVRTEHAFPVDWARTQNNLGGAYENLPTGGRGVNLQKAIACYEAAARGYEKAGISKEAELVKRLLAELLNRSEGI